MKKLWSLILICCILLTGCSSGKHGPQDPVTIKWQDGVMSYKGWVMPFNEYYGYTFTGTLDNGTNYYGNFEKVTSLEFCTINSGGVTEDNMDSFKDMKMWSRSLGSVKGYHYYFDADYVISIEAGGDALDVQIYDIITHVPCTEGDVKVDFGSFTFGSAYSEEVKVTAKGASVGSSIGVTKGEKPECTTPYVIEQNGKSYNLMTYSSANYAYYTYDGYVIQCALGILPDNYLTFHK